MQYVRNSSPLASARLFALWPFSFDIQRWMLNACSAQPWRRRVRGFTFPISNLPSGKGWRSFRTRRSFFYADPAVQRQGQDQPRGRHRHPPGGVGLSHPGHERGPANSLAGVFDLDAGLFDPKTIEPFKVADHLWIHEVNIQKEIRKNWQRLGRTSVRCCTLPA